MTDPAPGSASLAVVVVADGPLAHPTLDALLRHSLVAGLCTSRASMSGAPLRHHAATAGVPVFEADRAGVTEHLPGWVRERRADVLLSFAFPYRVPGQVLAAVRLGGFNVHGGRLPEYRGPQPVFWQIARREPEGAVTVHRMDEELDHGAIVASQRVPIAPDDTHGLHAMRLAFAAVSVVDVVLTGLVQHGTDLPAVAQDERRACFYPRPALRDVAIHWEQQTAVAIRAVVKAGNPWNRGAIAGLRGLEVRLTDVTLLADGGSRSTPPGTILRADSASGVIVNCVDGSALQLDVVSMEEGIIPGRLLATLGIGAGERFVTPPGVTP